VDHGRLNHLDVAVRLRFQPRRRARDLELFYASSSLFTSRIRSSLELERETRYPCPVADRQRVLLAEAVQLHPHGFNEEIRVIYANRTVEIAGDLFVEHVEMKREARGEVRAPRGASRDRIVDAGDAVVGR
jgi:hypothetical protein